MGKCSECRWFDGEMCNLRGIPRKPTSYCPNLCSRSYFTRICSCCRWFDGEMCNLRDKSMRFTGYCEQFARW